MIDKNITNISTILSTKYQAFKIMQLLENLK